MVTGINMRFLFLIFTSYLTYVTSCKSQNMPINNTSTSQIKIGEGISNLIIDKTTKKEVNKILGKGRKNRDIISFRNHHTTHVVYIYEDLGLKLIYIEKIRPLHDTLSLIEITSPSLYKTQDGIGIGSTRKEVELALGKPKKVIHEVLVNGGIMHKIWYNEVEFVFESKENRLDTEENDVVVRIEL